MTAVASAVVRTYDSSATVEATFASLRAQDVPVEIIVVDSGSTDGTLDLARRYADLVLEVPHEEFSYGGTLNRGAAAASAPVHVALSSHCTFDRTDWVRLASLHLSVDSVVGVIGQVSDAHGRLLDGPVQVTGDYLLAHPWWGFSNHASAWASVAWDAQRFSQDLRASEDKEWTWRAVVGSRKLVVDPRLVVPGAHRRAAGAWSYRQRLVKEMGATAHLRPLPQFGLLKAVRALWSVTPDDPYLSAAPRLRPTRVIEVNARYSAQRTEPRVKSSRFQGRPLCDGSLPCVLASTPVPLPN